MVTRILHFEKSGQGPALFFLHGFLGSLDNWRSIGRRFTDRFTVYWVDARNHGRSFWAPEMDYMSQVEDLLELMQVERLEKAFWVGHSMGGKTAMQLALHAAEKVWGLVVVDIAPRAYESGHEPILRALMQVPLQSFSRREEVDEFLAHNVSDAGIRQFLLKSLTRHAEGNFVWRWNLPVLYQKYSDILAAVQGRPYEGPALFIKGEKSPYITQADEKLIRELFPRASRVTIPNAGHWVHVDNPQAVYEALETFLAEVLRARRDSNPQPPDP